MTDFAFYGFRDGPGGLPQVMRNLMNHLVSQNFKVDLLLHHINPAELAPLDKRVRPVKLAGCGLPTRSRALLRYLKKNRPQTLMTNREPANRVVWLTLRKLKTADRPRFVARVGMTVSAALKRRNFWKRSLRQWSMRICYRSADAVIANAEDVARDLEKWIAVPKAKIRVLPNPTVDSTLFEEAGHKLEHAWLQNNSIPVIIAVGRLARQKDYPTLLKAFAALQGQPARLLILGEGKERPHLQKLIADLRIGDRAELVGYVANPFAWMARAQVFVLASAWEGSPNVLIQALALGLPSVATDCPGGNRDILAQGRYGPLVETGNWHGLARALQQTLAAPLPPEFLRQAVTVYQVENAAKAYLKVLLPACPEEKNS